VSHGHGHDHGYGLQRGRLAVVLAITVSVLVVEVVGALVSGSLALLADAGHMLTDAAGLSLALVAAVLAGRPATESRTWGYRRAEVLAAAAQAAVLLGVGVYVLVEGIRHLVAPEDVSSGIMLVFGVVGLLGNAVSLLILSRARGANLNTRAAFLEVLNDALGSVAVIVAAVTIHLTGWTRADAVVSLLIGVLILPRTWMLLRETVPSLVSSPVFLMTPRFSQPLTVTLDCAIAEPAAAALIAAAARTIDVCFFMGRGSLGWLIGGAGNALPAACRGQQAGSRGRTGGFSIAPLTDPTTCALPPGHRRHRR